MLISEQTKTVLKKQWKVSRIPIFLALIWTAISFSYKEPDKRTVIGSIEDFITALFFVMWFVGQYLRTSKEIKDSSNYSSIQTGITDLQRAINRLQKFSPQPPVQQVSSTSNLMLLEAQNAVKSGFVLAGLMQAGVAYEQAIVSKAENLQIYREDRIKIAQIINQLKKYYEMGTINELFAIWKLRNQLIHLTEEAARELNARPDLIKYFEWGINMLENESLHEYGT